MTIERVPRTNLSVAGTCLYVVLGFQVLAPTVAYAYIDPGAGSYYVQLIAAGLGGAALVVRQLWMRIRYPLSRRPSQTADEVSSADKRADQHKAEQ